MENGHLLPTPEHVLCAVVRHGVWHVLVQWGGSGTSTLQDATREPVHQIKDRYPALQLEDKLFRKEGSDVMTDIMYERRKRLGSVAEDVGTPTIPSATGGVA
jgi:hypothetical protein